jgi:threonine aldolase
MGSLIPESKLRGADETLHIPRSKPHSSAALHPRRAMSDGAGSADSTSLAELLQNHFDQKSNHRRGALPWAFFPDRLRHDFDEADEKDGCFVVCCVCHPGGLRQSAASSLSGGKQTGVFRYHWRTGQRSITDHVSKKHADALEALTEARDAHVRKHGDDFEGGVVGGKRPASDASNDMEDNARFFPVVKDGASDGIGTDSDSTPAAKQAKTGRGGARTGAGRPRQECPDVIDMRSDTVTKPTPAMRRAMAEAEVGDDVFGDDPTIIKLEEEMAATFGKEAAVFVPSGTMGNLIAVGVHCEVRGSEFICGSLAHIHIYEQGGLSTLMGAHPRPLTNRADGTLDLKDIEAAIRPDDQHFPVTKVLCLEQTHNKCGGRVLPLEYVDKCGEFAREHGIALHLDGARIWNAAAALGVTPARAVEAADSVSVCLSKALGAPVGSVVVGTRAFIAKCRRLRKACGGTMRQAGTLAAAALTAHGEIGPLIHVDHSRMSDLAAGLSKIQGLKVQRPVQSNIAFVNLDERIDVKWMVAEMKKKDVVLIPWVGNSLRLVTHHEINQPAVAKVLRCFEELCAQALEPVRT